MLGRVLSLSARAVAPRVACCVAPFRALSAPGARSISSTAARSMGAKITFVEEGEAGLEDTSVVCDATLGDTLLDVALDHDVDIEGACGGELACSTCHIVLKQEDFDRLEAPDEEEEDMLDLAWGLTDTSRLCCQIEAAEWMDGMEVVVPSETSNMME